MFLDITFEKALALLNRAELVYEEIIVPKICHRASHCPYLPEYDWLFLVERKLARFLDPWMMKHRPELIGPSGIVSEALSNAYCHGHKRDPYLPITIRIYLGGNGVMVQITDTGKGFNVDAMVSNFQAKKNYFHNAGNGIKRMFSSKVFGLFYNDKGSTFNLVYMFDNKLDSHKPD